MGGECDETRFLGLVLCEMLDINLLREEKGGNPDLVRKSQERRHADVTLVDQVIAVDVQWRQEQFKVDNLRAEYGKKNKEVATKKKAKEDADDLIAEAKAIDADIKKAEEVCNEFVAKRDELLKSIGNIVHDSVPVSDDEDNNAIVRTHNLEAVLGPNPPTFATCKELDAALVKKEGLMSHVDLVPRLKLADTERGTMIAGMARLYPVQLSASLISANFVCRQQRILLDRRRRDAESSAHQLWPCVPPRPQVHAHPDPLLHGQGGDGQRGTACAVRRGALQGIIHCFCSAETCTDMGRGEGVW